MRYDPLQATQLLYTDRARFYVAKGDDHEKEVTIEGKKVKKESVKLFLKLTTPDGLKGQCTNYLATPDQIQDFIKATGGTDEDFKKGVLHGKDCEGLGGDCIIKIEEYNGVKKNALVRYLPFKPKEEAPFNDDVNF